MSSLLISVLLVGGVHISPATQVFIKSVSAHGTATGSGTIVRKNMVLTAAHVVEDSIVNFASCKNEMMPVVPVLVEKENDLALMKFVGECDVEPIVLAISNPEVSDDVYAIGCPAGRCFTITKGIISAYFKKGDSLRIVADIGAFFGNSGGALINSAGQLVGVCSSLSHFSKIYMDEDGVMEVITQKYINFIPINVILEFLGKVK